MIMNNFYSHLLIVLLPLLFSNILHMLLIKKGVFNSLTTPISENKFGKNKTYRGLVFVTIINAIILMMMNYILQLQVNNSFFLGAMLGLAYIIFELPNSYMKRKLGIKPGEQHKKYKLTFSLIDKMDSAFGVTLTYSLLGYIDYKSVMMLFLLASLTHIIMSKLLVFLKIKKTF